MEDDRDPNPPGLIGPADQADAPPATAPVPPVPPANPWAPSAPPAWGAGQPPETAWWTSAPGGGPYGPGGYGGPGGPVPPYGAPPWHWGAPPPAAPHVGRTAATMAVATGVLIAAIAGGVVGHALWNTNASTPSNNSPFSFGAPNQPTTPQTPGAGSPTDAGAIASKVDPGLVDINTEVTNLGAAGAATGMVLTPNGEVLTNNHVVEGASKITVTDVGNGRTYNATVVGYDRSHDVAVLQLTGASGLQTVTTANSNSVSVGQGVVAVGNAEGAGGTPSYAGGSITAINQSITASDELDGSSEQLTGLIETNADIVSGDSGGPLVNTQGRVIAMDTAASSGYQFQGGGGGGQGFAVPINTALSIAQNIENGKSSSTTHVGQTAYLGVAVVTNGAGNGLGGTSTPGALIQRLLSGGPAENAGLVPGDVITSLDGHNVATAEGLTTVMLGEKAGATVTIGYVDTAGAQQTTTVTLASGPAQ